MAPRTPTRFTILRATRATVLASALSVLHALAPAPALAVPVAEQVTAGNAASR